ncbi:MAG: HAD-IC family P-type ATPase, partial [Acetatifactor sp.]|nr:HAD-IC family P-type ATPase [Acetatifactor sp.]
MFEQRSVSETISQLKTDGQGGLTFAEAGRRLKQDGRNEMKEARKKTVVESFLEQLNDPLIYVLIVAAAVSVLLKEVSDAIIIGVVVVLNAVVGMMQEGKARRALDSLKKLTSPKAMVIREGRRLEIPAAELVKGDLVYLEAGCQVPADLRLTGASNLKIEESALTGESLPMEKDSSFIAPGDRTVPLGDRRNMAYMSTIVTYGRGEGLVVSTGMDTELGKIASMITEAREELTPLQKRLGELGKVLSLLSLLLCAGLFAIAVLQRRNVPEMLITAISLAVAAVPEGLPAVVTICLALSVTRMVRVNTIVRRLPSVETLGAVSVVCSDKTGTLTQNRMTVEKCFLNGRLRTAEELRVQDCPDFFYGCVLCNDAEIQQGSRIGDPTELALLDLAGKAGVEKSELEQRMPRVDELSFDSDRKMMTTLHRQVSNDRMGYGARGELRAAEVRSFTRQSSLAVMEAGAAVSKVGAGGADAGGRTVAYTKGAPDEVLKRCSHILTQQGVVRLTESHRRQMKKVVEELSGEALRTLAVAMRPGAAAPREEQLTFLGIV